MDKIIRISALAHRVILGNPQKTKDYLFKALSQINDLCTDIIILPALSVCGASLGSFYKNRALMENCLTIVKDIAKKTAKTGAYVIAGIPIVSNNNILQVSAVIHNGKILGYIPVYEPSEGLNGVYECGECTELLPPETLFGCGNLKFSVVGCDPRHLSVYAAAHVNAGADIIVNVSAVKASAGFIEECRNSAAVFSENMGVAVALCNGNIGESCADSLYRSFSGIFECGEELEFKVHDNSYFISTADIDEDIISSLRTGKYRCAHESFSEHIVKDKDELLRSVTQDPYVPSDKTKAERYIADCFELQVRAVAGRMRNSSIQKAVVGCSGGIDSTLTLLVCSEALKKMHQPLSNLIAVRMDCFDTRPEDTLNADTLVGLLGATVKKIQIGKACLQHFNDIGYNASNKNAVYDYTQERERMQIMLDIATGENAIVVGTSDLSEIALGFTCAGGDITANYNINGCFTKNTVEKILAYAAKAVFSGELSECIENILSVPVSPLLFPLNEEGRKPENLSSIGRYDLYDFFLYYFVKYNMEPRKIFSYAMNAFNGKCTASEIKNAMTVFFKRFFDGQRSRRYTPESPDIGAISLTKNNYTLPPDAALTCIPSEVGNIEI